MVYSVAFISTEQEHDLILSFAITEEASEDILSLTLLRTPQYEHSLLPDERGISVSWEKDENLDELLKAVERSKNLIKLNTNKREITLDLSRVKQPQLNNMRKVLQKMNFDKVIRLKGF